MREYKYSDVLEEEVLNKFPSSKERQISEIKLSQDFGYFIDVKKICEIIGIEIKEENLLVDFDINDFGKSSTNEKIITINPTEHENIKRFTIAQKLGHFVLNNTGASNITQLPEQYRDVISKMNETIANDFATKLLIPVKLVKFLMTESIKRHEYNSNSLSSQELKVIIREVATELKVSEIALNYTIENNKLIKEASS